MDVTNNTNTNAAANVTPQNGQKLRITIKPKSGGISITIVPGEGPAVVHNKGQANRPAHSKRARRFDLPPNQEFAFPRCTPSNPDQTPVEERGESSAPASFQYVTELEQLKSEGYRCNRWIEKLLVLNNGNLEETRQMLNKKKAKKEAIREQYASQLSRLHDAGFNRDCINLRLLKKFNGDLEQTLNKLLDCQDKFNKLVAHRTQSPEELEAKKVQYENQLELLHQAGFNRDRFLICLLDRFDGNVEAVLTKLNKKKLRFEAKTVPFQSQLEQLRQAGFCQDRINYRLLKACDGDVEKVLRVLSHSKSKSLEKNKIETDCGNASSSSVPVTNDGNDDSSVSSNASEEAVPPFCRFRRFEHGRPLRFPACHRSGGAYAQGVQNMPAFAAAHSAFGAPFHPSQAAAMGGPQFAQGRPQPPMCPPFAARPMPM